MGWYTGTWKPQPENRARFSVGTPCVNATADAQFPAR
jgi:hypothetical protein